MERKTVALQSIAVKKLIRQLNTTFPARPVIKETYSFGKVVERKVVEVGEHFCAANLNERTWVIFVKDYWIHKSVALSQVLREMRKETLKQGFTIRCDYYYPSTLNMLQNKFKAQQRIFLT